MKAIRLAWLELRRFRGSGQRLVPVVLLLVPLLCAALFLWSNWDPFARMGRLPVAVVNSDQPIRMQGQRIDAGAQFMRRLKTTDDFDWRFVASEEAQRGLREGHYAFTIRVPRDFSTRLATASTGPPQHAQLWITKNDANGYLTGIMADTAQAKLQNQINAAAHAAYVHAFYGEVGRAREKLQTASEIAKQLVTGSDLNRQTTEALTRGLDGVRDGAGQITQGVRTITNAATQANRHLTSATALIDPLPDTGTSLSNASNVAANSLGAVRTSTESAMDLAGENAVSLQELGQKHPGLSQDPAFQRALENARALAGTTASANSDAQRALGAAQDANNRALALRNSLGGLQSQVRSIAASVATISESTAQLAGAGNGLATSLNTLTSGSGVLRTTAEYINDNAKRIGQLLNDAVTTIPPTTPPHAAAAEVLAAPAQISTTNLNPAYAYGRGIAPLVLAIALWIFGLIGYLLLRPVNQRALAYRLNAASIMFAGLLPAACLGVLVGLVLVALIHFGLGLNPADPLWTIGLVSLTAVTFTAINQFLRVALGATGSLLSLVLLSVQVTASGGTYPMATQPLPVQVIHPFLPMSYAVDGLRIAITGGMDEHLLRDAIVLGTVFVALLALTSITVWRQRMWTIGRLHPRIVL